jgi:hypothetical protein
MMRYSMAKLKGSDAYRQVLKEDTELLRGFGLKLMSVESGISAAVLDELEGDRIDPWTIMDINMKVWKWLYPLLHRLNKAEQRVKELEAMLQEDRRVAK